MKRNIILALLLVLGIGLGNVLEGQTTHKKKKKKKKTTTEHTVNIDSINAARVQDSLANLAKIPAKEPVDSLTVGLVADTADVAYSFVTLDTAKPVDGFYKQPILKGAKP